ncbi:UbiX family flavin prenyltransferase [Aurantimonas sp. E1-2-R+4]|uniref:UbiX family flavin prenyltransferase n=1 Tax=Aurantimonas sp. E1-2-R+4 TaxID=3113714 RepID=UPI002F94952F
MSAAPVILGVSGASGAAIALRLAELLSAAAVSVELIVTRGAERTLNEEVGPDALARLDRLATRRHAIDDLGATVASGSYPVAGMIVAPCSMRSLGAIANSLSDNLLVRAADVQLKERRRLVLIARESPLHLGHLRAMCAVTEMGAIVAPPSPAFYLKPVTSDEIIDQIARRAADLLGVLPPMARQWTDACRPPLSRPGGV